MRPLTKPAAYADPNQTRLSHLPPHSYNAKYNNITYFFYGGVFYRYDIYNYYYYVVPAPIGFHVPRLPYGVNLVYVNGRTYYYYYDTYYAYDCGSNVYIVVDPPQGVDENEDGDPDEVSANLPTPGYDRIILIGGSSVEGVFLGGDSQTVDLGVGSDTLHINLTEVVRIDFASVATEETADPE